MEAVEHRFLNGAAHPRRAEVTHAAWLGMAQPEGLVVTRAALDGAEARITWPVVDLQATLRELAGAAKSVCDLRALFREVFAWPDDAIVERSALPASLRVSLGDGEWLEPDYALRSGDGDG